MENQGAGKQAGTDKHKLASARATWVLWLVCHLLKHLKERTPGVSLGGGSEAPDNMAPHLAEVAGFDTCCVWKTLSPAGRAAGEIISALVCVVHTPGGSI